MNGMFPLNNVNVKYLLFTKMCYDKINSFTQACQISPPKLFTHFADNMLRFYYKNHQIKQFALGCFDAN